MDNFIKILLVEDNKDDAVLILRKLKKAGYDPSYVVVSNIDDMRYQLEKQSWDLIITDHYLPGFRSLDSIELARSLVPDTPIIVLSGNTEISLVVKVLRAGAHDFVQKDEFQSNSLIPVVKSAIKEGNRRRENTARAKRLKMYERAVEHSRNIIYITDNSGNIEHVNKRFVDVTGKSLDQVKGRAPDIFYADDENGLDWYDIQNEVVISKQDWSGEMLSRDKDKEVFPALVSVSPILDNNDKVSNLVVVAEDFSKYQATMDDLKIKAFHDHLTALPNRFLFEEQLDLILKSVHRKAPRDHDQVDYSKERRFAALLCLDLDKFKQINDTLGHLEGDKLLKTVANRIKSCVRESDTVARIGGDEFSIILSSLDKEAEAAVVADKILQSLTQPIKLSSESKTISASIGIAIMPSDGNDTYELKENGDKALYRAKNNGRNNFQFYNESLNVKAQDILRDIGTIKDH